MGLFVFLAFTILYVIKLPTLKSKEYRRDLIVFSTLMLIAFMISILVAVGVRFPYITTEITTFFEKTFHL